MPGASAPVVADRISAAGSVVSLSDALSHPVGWPEHGFPHAFFLSLTFGGCLGIAGQTVVYERLVELRITLPGTQMADSQVVSDAQQPRCEGSTPRLETADRLPGLEEGLSGEIFSLLDVIDDVVDVPVDTHYVAVVQFGEGLGVTKDGPLHEHSLVGYRRYVEFKQHTNPAME